MSHKELLYGCTAGAISQMITYPIDTIKTRIQLGNISLTNPYKGIVSPLTCIVLEKGVLFYSYNLIHNHIKNSFNAGLIAGLVTTVGMVPFERIKVVSQDKKISSVNALYSIYRKDGISSLYRGWAAMLFREVPGYGIYFTTYEYIKEKKQNQPLTIKESFLTGTTCGVAAWIFIYPSDPIKTRMQRHNVSLKTAANSIIQENGIRGLYKGYHWGLLRAGLFHGFVLLGYEKSKQLF